MVYVRLDWILEERGKKKKHQWENWQNPNKMKYLVNSKTPIPVS